MATIEFSTFSITEGAAWLGPDRPRPKKSLTLAELLVKRGDISEESTNPDPDLSIGAYL